MSRKTIFACSSGSGRSAIAVWRVSGPRASAVSALLTGTNLEPRQASYRVFRDQNENQIDDGIAIWFPGPHTATGEDVLELHTHGSLAVRTRMIDVLSEMGLSPAAPGEFTLRALENGKMDLLAVEALGDLLDAETEAQRQQAIRAGAGEGTRLLARWRDDLVSALGVLEASVDFPDEEDIPADSASRALPKLKKVHSEMTDHLDDGRGRRLREGVTLAIIGAPNVGKSSFINKLSGEDRAIVSDIAGTTRDVVTARVILADRLVNVLDTAGLHEESTDPIELAGMDRAKKAAEDADIVVWLRDATVPVPDLDLGVTGELVIIDNKMDKLGWKTQGEIALSLATGDGWSDLLKTLERHVASLASPSVFSHERQVALIRHGADRLTRAIMNAEQGHLPELLADDVRMCLDALDQLEGRRTTEAVLGQIFSSFCIGK